MHDVSTLVGRGMGGDARRFLSFALRVWDSHKEVGHEQ